MADWQTLTRRAANEVGVPVPLFRALVWQESRGKSDAVSPAGALGYTQLMPGTARALGVNPRDPWQNLIGGARYLKQQLNTFGGNIDKALAAYNAGPGAVQKYGGVPPYAETQNYVRSIKSMAGHVGNIPAGPTGTNSQVTPGVSGTGAPTLGFDSSSGVDVSSLLSALQQQKPAPASVGLQAPSFSAGPALPKGYQSLASTGAPQQQPDVQSLLSLVRTPGIDASVGGAPATGADTGAAPAGAPGAVIKGAKAGVPVADLTSEGGVHPTEGLAGFPARDYFAPAGTAAVAPVSGKVIRLSGHDPKLGPVEGPHGPLGWSVYIRGADGRTYYLTHMGSRDVRVGQRVQAGQQIGTVANYAKYGTPSHIHMGVSGR